MYAWYHQFTAVIPKLRDGALNRVKGVFEFRLDLCERKFVALKETGFIDISLIQILFTVDQSLDERMRLFFFTSTGIRIIGDVTVNATFHMRQEILAGEQPAI